MKDTDLCVSLKQLLHNVKISIFLSVAKEKHWLLETLITILIQGIAHDEASLDPYLYKYQDRLKLLKLTLHYTRFSTNATVPKHTHTYHHIGN